MYIEHITKQGERWDMLAWRYYRDVSKISLLIEANSVVPITETLSSGMRLVIPVVESETDDAEVLPPWKR